MIFFPSDNDILAAGDVCEPALYQRIGSHFKKLNLDTGEYDTLISGVPGLHGGYSLKDDVMYGIAWKNKQSHLYRIEGTTVTDLGVIGGNMVHAHSFYAGDMDWDGNFYVYKYTGVMCKINTQTVEATCKTMVGVTPRGIADIVYVFGVDSFYGLDSYHRLYRIDWNEGDVTLVKDYGSSLNDFYSAFGAGWTDINGTLYFSNNKSGKIWAMSLDGDGIPYGTAVLAIDGESTASNDGFGCPLMRPPFEVMCDDDIDNDSDGLTDECDPSCSEDANGNGVGDVCEQSSLTGASLLSLPGYLCGDMLYESSGITGSRTNGQIGQASVRICSVGDLQVQGFSLDFGVVEVSTTPQNIAGTVIGNNGYITVNDTKGTSGWRVTVDVTDLESETYTIPDYLIKMDSYVDVTTLAGGETDEIVGVSNTNINFNGDVGYSIMKRTGNADGAIGAYGVQPGFSMTIPAYQSIGEYKGVVTVTLLEV